MAVQETKNVKITEKLQSVELEVHEVEENSIIVNVQGWRMRIYFDKSIKEIPSLHSIVKVNYLGNIENPHTVRFEKLK